MPKRTDINTILLIGSGPIVIGQACEFDYSGTQAVKTLKEQGYRVILINSNPATIMTDPEFADRTYIEPIKEDVIAEIIKKEKVDAVLPTMGGQTALNVATSMYEKGMLKGVEFLGATPEAIHKGEDRSAFNEAMIKIGMDLPKSENAYSVEEAIEAVKKIGFPVISRASFTLAGGGSGVAYNMEEFKVLAEEGISASPVGEIEIMESMLGWKEYEMEVIRDKADNCIIICAIENFDPMGVHTGDSITVAPALTLTDKEYQRMRDASFDILREIGVDTGGSNVQFSICPKTGRMIVIEMNPRVSRSSALASKATGYPIAKVATLLAIGYTLDEITNDITGTPASFEPVIDYVVTKIPRFTFEKFPEAKNTLSTSMKSVGEVMAIGRTFKESMQKALCSLETDLCGFNEITADTEFVKHEIRRPNADRVLYVAEGFRRGMSVEDMFDTCAIDPWFLYQLHEIIEDEADISDDILFSSELMRKAKVDGFSDKRISQLIEKNSQTIVDENEVYKKRKSLGVSLEFNEVDTCAAEFEALTPYLYSTTNITASLDAKNRVSKKRKVLILGGGPNRIGQGIEFDYCCVHAAFALKEMDIECIMYNCNPETVSTDYDTSDVLYFEPIDLEHVREVIENEEPDGIIVHFGGQTPLKLADALTKIGANIAGTPSSVIDLAEDREKFSDFINKYKLKQPQNGLARTKEEAPAIAQRLGFPVLVRPSFVLGGRGMKIVYSQEELAGYMALAISVSNEAPVLIDKFLDQAIELDVDAISDGDDVYIGSVMQHIEEAGIHSGDSACSLPPVNLSQEMIQKVEQQTKTIALGLGVIGLMNVQYAIYQDEIYLIEVNPRASRTVPFVSKATGMPLAKVATRVMVGETLRSSLEYYDKYNIVQDKDGLLKPKLKGHISVKEAVFPFHKLYGADLVLGPEMKSTGEVMGISKNFGVSFAKAQLSAGNKIPTEGTCFLSFVDSDKVHAKEIAQGLHKHGFKLVATKGTQLIIEQSGIPCKRVLKISEGRPNIEDSMKNDEIAMAINTSDNNTSKKDAVVIRQEMLRKSIPYFTTLSAARALISALDEMGDGSWSSSTALQDFLA
ncbi:MAG: carbamoyl-phosphate synthase large subunit [Sulfurimonas sp.]|nr:carbamoyl-phosphate synthase large subunit [Sulfurimonas sp.]